jgi:hypothetical protein
MKILSIVLLVAASLALGVVGGFFFADDLKGIIGAEVDKTVHVETPDRVRFKRMPAKSMLDFEGVFGGGLQAVNLVWRFTGATRTNVRSQQREAHYVWKLDLKNQSTGEGWQGTVRIHFFDSADLLLHTSQSVSLSFPVSESGFMESLDGEGYVPVVLTRLVHHATWSGEYSACGQVGNPCPPNRP